MIEITWRYEPGAPPHPMPGTYQEALAMLRSGNRTFAGLTRSRDGQIHHVVPIEAGDLGLGDGPGRAPRQSPYAAVIGCADARVPLELVFLESANSIFAVRVAGNVLGAECVGSLDYAISHLPSVRLLAALGHTRCGAVGAAVDAYLDPTKYLALAANLPLRAIIDSLMPIVRGAARALRLRHTTDVVQRAGYRAVLIDTAVVVNTAVTADAISRLFADRLTDGRGVAFGVYDLSTRRVGLPAPEGSADRWKPGMVSPPSGLALEQFVMDLVASPHLTRMLDCQ